MIRIERLRPALTDRFFEFADRSTLQSLAPLRATHRIPEDQVFLCALHVGHVVGCTSYRPGYRMSYVGLDGSAVGTDCVYLCSSEVLPEYRGAGVGGGLYARRLAECGRFAGTAVVEILGEGTPFSVDALSRRGLDWHLARGFRIVGHSRDDDGGPVLARGVSAADGKRASSPCDLGGITVDRV